ncbi:MAG: hypothetical protein DMG74_17760 [Acidobacteria bacterium]|nr:MAG: hypothetical protein DMG74_17760 [Acidobacteriota bacterium]
MVTPLVKLSIITLNEYYFHIIDLSVGNPIIAALQAGVKFVSAISLTQSLRLASGLLNST